MGMLQAFTVSRGVLPSIAVVLAALACLAGNAMASTDIRAQKQAEAPAPAQSTGAVTQMDALPNKLVLTMSLDLSYEPEDRGPALVVMGANHPMEAANHGDPGFLQPHRGVQFGWILPSTCDAGRGGTPLGILHESVDFECDERSFALSLSIRNR